METLKLFFNRLPWRIIKTTLSVIVAVALLPSISYFLFRIVFPFYPFVFQSHNEIAYIGSSSTAIYFTAMAATKGVGNSLTSTWKAISSQIVSNFFGALVGIVISYTLAESFGSTHPLTIGIGIFVLYLILKRLQLHDAFTLGGITFITIVVLSSADYPPFVRGVDRFYSMAVGLVVSAVINILFLSPKKSVAHLFQHLITVQKRFCLQDELSIYDYHYIESEMKQIQQDTLTLVQDEKIEKKIFFWRSQNTGQRNVLDHYVKQSQLLYKMDTLRKTRSTRLPEFDSMYDHFKKAHYQLIKKNEKGQLLFLVEELRNWLFLNRKQIEKLDIVQFLDCLNRYEQLLIKE